MSLLQTFLRVFPSTCRHSHTYRERRELHGMMVMHFVCEDCGHATPAVERTADEHRAVVKIGDRKNSRVVRHPHPTHVVAMNTRSRKKPA